jgi:thiosulfate/3-mercaptopyruvate sulfurtransferase
MRLLRDTCQGEIGRRAPSAAEPFGRSAVPISVDAPDTKPEAPRIITGRGYHARVLTLPGPLVGVDWLADHLDDPALRVADVRWSLTGPSGRERYDAGHLPGAVYLDADRELSSPGEGQGRHPVPTAEKLANVLGGRGIGDEHVVVAYDDAGGSIAARLWWLYRHYGHDGRCAVLDGDIAAWTRSGRLLTTDAPAHPPATWTPGPVRDDLVDTAAVEAMLGGPTLLLDARAAERYRGETEPIDPRAGHIPGAVSAPHSGNLGPDGCFLPPEQLRERYAALGAADRPVVAYCGSSLSATHRGFVEPLVVGSVAACRHRGSTVSETEGWGGWDEGADDRIGRKRDRLARLLSVVSILYSKGSGEAGVPVSEIARLTGMTTRTVYRDINALDEELGVPVFQAGRGR